MNMLSTFLFAKNARSWKLDPAIPYLWKLLLNAFHFESTYPTVKCDYYSNCSMPHYIKVRIKRQRNAWHRENLKTLAILYQY